ncbi:MAG: hypothetical protein QMA81_00480 [Candidatus Blochmannia vicinus]|nr:MAG: hypothetical protein QMA81_00480 [Candidatus Blochmannia vicinus]
MSILFISDIHLRSESPDVTDGFLHFLNYCAVRAQSLYILGDLFEIWLGDDDYKSLHINIAKALKRLNKKKFHVILFMAIVIFCWENSTLRLVE